jgi:hypothetical protein
LAIGYPTIGFEATGLQWWNGPDEDLGYVVAHPNALGARTSPTGLRNSNAQYFSYFTRNLYMWTSESVNWGVAWNNDGFNRRADLNEKYGMSVRCILDTGGFL